MVIRPPPPVEKQSPSTHLCELNLGAGQQITNKDKEVVGNQRFRERQ